MWNITFLSTDYHHVVDYDSVPEEVMWYSALLLFNQSSYLFVTSLFGKLAFQKVQSHSKEPLILFIWIQYEFNINAYSSASRLYSDRFIPSYISVPLISQDNSASLPLLHCLILSNIFSVQPMRSHLRRDWAWLDHGWCGSRHPAGMAPDGSWWWERHAAYSSRAAVYAPTHVWQCGQVLRELSSSYIPASSL